MRKTYNNETLKDIKGLEKIINKQLQVINPMTKQWEGIKNIRNKGYYLSSVYKTHYSREKEKYFYIWENIFKDLQERENVQDVDGFGVASGGTSYFSLSVYVTYNYKRFRLWITGRKNYIICLTDRGED